MQFDQDTIKELAVYTVQQFVTNQVPLDESIAEKAKAFKLNEDQVRRVVESVNVIAFLKLREGASDKTFEFKLASFQGVMDALVGRGSKQDYVDVTPQEESMSKAAFDVGFSIPEDQSHQTLSRGLFHLRAELEKVAQDHYHCVSDLERYIPVLVKQANWQERLSMVSGDDFSRLMKAFDTSGFEKSASLKDMVFVGKELEVANHIVGLLKQAGELSSRKELLDSLEKRAVAALLGKLALGAFRGAKSIATNPLGAAAKATTFLPAAAAGAVGKGVGWTGKSLKRTKLGVMGAVGVAASATAYNPKTNNRTGRPNDVWNNIYN